MKELILNDREIIPISRSRFGVIVTEAEAIAMLEDGYVVKVISSRIAISKRTEENTIYYLVVDVKSHQIGGFDLAMLETTRRGDITVRPFPWEVGRLKGIKAYAKSVTVREAHADDRP